MKETFPSHRKDDKLVIDWRFLRYFSTIGCLLHVNTERREVVVFIPKNEVTFLADVSSYVNMEKLKINRVYELTFAVYVSEATPLIKKMLIKELQSPYLIDVSKYRKEYNLMKLKKIEEVIQGSKFFYRFELLKAVNPIYSSLTLKRFEQIALKSYHTNSKYRWRHLLGF